MKIKLIPLMTAGLMMMAFQSGNAYDGTNCKAAGNCWEAKPGYPDKIKGSKFDPKHSKTELEKQTTALKAMEERNAARAKKFKETGKWEM